MENIPVVAVCGEFAGDIEISFDLISAFKHQSCGAITEKNAGTAIGPVDNGRKFFRTDQVIKSAAMKRSP